MNESILDAREKRWNYKCRLAVETGLTIVSVTLNIPAGCKNDKVFSDAHNIILHRLVSELRLRNFYPYMESLRYGADGPEGCIAVLGDPIEIKKICIGIEMLPGYRIADIDVMRPDTVAVSRKDIGADDRCCFICDKSARFCIVNKSHIPDEIKEAAVSLAMEVLKDEESKTF